MESKLAIKTGLQYLANMEHIDNNKLLVHDHTKFKIIDIQSGESQGAEFSDIVMPVMQNGQKQMFFMDRNRNALGIYNIKTKELDFTADFSLAHNYLKDLHDYAYDSVNNCIYFSDHSNDPILGCYDFSTQFYEDFKVDGPICSLALHAGTRNMCIGYSKGVISLYDLSSRELKLKIDLPKASFKKSPSYSCKYSPNGKYIMVGADHYFKINVADGKPVLLQNMPANNNGFPFAFHSFTGILAIFNPSEINDDDMLSKYTIEYWDLNTEKNIYSTPKTEGCILDFLCFSPDGKTQTHGLSNNTIELLSVPSEMICNLGPTYAPYIFFINELKKRFNIPSEIGQYIFNLFMKININ
jgi:WD40 repeat protein